MFKKNINEEYGGIELTDLFDYWGCANLNAREAKILCNKYISDIPERLYHLTENIKKENNEMALDYSPKSLIPLWEWFEIESKFEKTSIPFYKRNFFTKNISNYELPTLQTFKIALGISDYYGETILKNFDLKLKWDYFTKPKNLASVNQPVILGFPKKISINPRIIVYNCILKSHEEGYDKMKLYLAYNNLSNYFVSK